MHRFFLLLSLLLVSSTARADQPTLWKSGAGSWADASRWSAGLPTDLREVFVPGKSEITVPTGRHSAGMLRLGIHADDQVRVRIQGELIVRRDFVQVGEYKGGSAEIVLENGALHAVSALYVGGANSGPQRGAVGKVTVQAGSLLARVLTLGWSAGSRSTLAIEGSKPSAVHLLDALYIGADHKESLSEASVKFTLDQQGVTPISIASQVQGLSISPSSTHNRTELQIALSAVPPRDDVTLFALRRQAKGTFTNLPEGAQLSARFAGREYRWTLTYKGGKSGCDVVLTQVQGHADESPRTTCRPVPKPPAPLWLAVNSRPKLPERWEPAFAGAEGFGSLAQGGRNGRIIKVTNLKDSGPGSLREAVLAKGPRLVQFEVGGTIDLLTEIQVREPYLTVDGSQAPAPGITLRHRGMTVATHDVILRYFRIQLGLPSSEWEGDALEFRGAERCIADHLSLNWATDETLSIVGLSDCITVQWCLLAEPLNDRKHSYGSILGGERTSWHHNLYAHVESRVPRFAGIAQTDFRNNVLYDWGHTAGYGQFERVNYVGNYLKPGPSTRQKPLYFHNGDSVVADRSLYLAGNVLAGSPDVSKNNPRGVGYSSDVLSAEPFVCPPVTTEEAAQAYERVLEKVGANRPVRDRTDERIVKQVREGTGKIVERVP